MCTDTLALTSPGAVSQTSSCQLVACKVKMNSNSTLGQSDRSILSHSNSQKIRTRFHLFYLAGHSRDLSDKNELHMVH